MQITIHNTGRVIDVLTPDGFSTFKARVWEGATDKGVPVYCVIARIAVDAEADQSQFQRELHEVTPPTPDSWVAIPAKIVLR